MVRGVLKGVIKILPEDLLELELLLLMLCLVPLTLVCLELGSTLVPFLKNFIFGGDSNELKGV